MASSLESSSEGGGALGTVSGIVAKVENAFNLVAAIVIFLLMFFMVAEVLGRKLLNAPIPGAIDWIEVSMATFAFLGAAYCQRQGGHVRMEVVMSRLRGSALWIVEAIAVAIALFYVCVIAQKSFVHFMRAYEIGDSTIDIQLPVWPSKLIVPVALSLLAIRLAIQLWGYIRLAINPQAEPIAVPVIKDVAEVAREEIREVLHDDFDRPDDNNRPDDGQRRD